MAEIKAATTPSRADRHRNPLAFTTDIAKQARLTHGEEYTQGDSFKQGKKTYYTARLTKGMEIQLTIRVLNLLGFATDAGNPRWSYMQVSWNKVWYFASMEAKKVIIGHMYIEHEGGVEMRGLFE